MHRLARLPILTSLRGYERSWLSRDLTAGVLIVALAIPLSMGMAELAGMPPVAGLYSCILPLVAYAFFGSSRQLVVALDASTAAMLAAAVAALAGGDPLRYAALAGGLTLLVGAVLLVAGIARLGLIADFLSEPVLLGYQAGLALVVVASQLPRMLGLTVEADATLERYLEILRGLGEIEPAAAAVGLATFATVVLLRRWKPTVPGALIALVAAALAVFVFDLEQRGVAALGRLPSGLPDLAVPDVALGDLRTLVPAAAAIALVAAADTLVSSRAFAVRGGYEVKANGDLIGLGAANISSAVSGGITASASAARTAVAESVGSRSQVAGLTAATLMAAVLLFLTGPLAYVPVATLAAIVIVAVLRLIELPTLRTLWRVRRVEWAIAIAAAAGVVAIGVLEGVVIAMGLSLLDFLWRTTRPRDAVLGVVPGRAGYHDVARAKGARTLPGVLVYRFGAPLFYANAERFRTRVRTLARRGDGTRLVVVDASTVSDIDVTAGRMLGELQEELAARGVRLVVAEALRDVRELLVGDELKVDFTAADMYDTVDEAVAAAGVGPEVS
ncbi:MAG: SulP family inorganic anion transporter [Thermoleophilia bacterium]|nr:SulP family inorganic anion transporter [Thermoleophilia bacterium]